MNIGDYTIKIWYSKEDNCYISSVMEFEETENIYCKAHGDTPQEALQEMLIAGQMTIDSIIENNQPLPEPLKHVA